MSAIPDCGGAPINGAMAMALGPGISLTLVRSDGGFCFSTWSRYDGAALPDVSDANKQRPFPTPEEAATFFRGLVGL